MGGIPEACTCAVTGASGYVGSTLASYLEAKGWRVHRLSRRPAGAVWSTFDLRDGLQPEFFRARAIQALIHCAWDFRARDWSHIYATNVEGSMRVLSAARAGGVRTGVFLSSMSAFHGCKSLYGKGKLAVEEKALSLGYVVVRPGLIYGSRPGGVVGALLKLVERSRVVPLIAADAVLYMTHEDDLCELVRALIMARPVETPITAASPRKLAFHAVIKALGERAGKSVTFVPIPWQAAWAALRLAESFRLPVPFRSDSVISLVNQNPSPDFAATQEVGIMFRDLSHGSG